MKMKHRTSNIEHRTSNEPDTWFGVQRSMLDVRCFPLLLAALLFGFSSADATNVSGTISTDTTWTLAGSPYIVTSPVNVSSNITLTIDPGVEVQFTNSSTLNVRGRILAEGNSANHIRFTHGGATKTGSVGLTNNGFAQCRFSYVDFDGLATASHCLGVDSVAVYLDHVLFTNSSIQYINLHNASFLIQDSILPNIPAPVELITGHVIPANGYGIIQRCIVGMPSGGVQDDIDFTGGQRPGPIFQAYSNIFTGAVDDGLDLDGTDADIEGNIFVNCIDRNGDAGDTGSAISGGNDVSGSVTNTSHIMIARNIFYNCSHGALCKEGNFYVIMDNTFVDIKEAVVNFNEPLRAGVYPGAGAIFSGNIVSNTPLLFENFTNGVMKLLVDHCLLPTSWPGESNLVGAPLFINGTPSTNSWTTFTNDFRLQNGSPGIGTGPNGLDIGALVPPGASISGEPSSSTTNKTATLKIAGPGIVSYQWRTNSGPWSAFTALTNTFNYNTNLFGTALPISLTNLAPGTYTAYVVGINSAGQTNAATISKSWTVIANSGSASNAVLTLAHPFPGNGLQFTITNGPSLGSLVILETTNVALPFSQWTTNLVGSFDGNGNFSTNLPNSATNNHRFYILKQ